jgi:hypothetical protein
MVHPVFSYLQSTHIPVGVEIMDFVPRQDFKYKARDWVICQINDNDLKGAYFRA